MVAGSRQKRFVINMQLKQRVARVKPFRLKKKLEKARFCLAVFENQKRQVS